MCIVQLNKPFYFVDGFNEFRKEVKIYKLNHIMGYLELNHDSKLLKKQRTTLGAIVV